MFNRKAKLFLATDHAGFEHKNALRDYLVKHNSHGFEVIDLGAFTFNKTDDYPHIMSRAAQMVARNPDRHRAVIFGGSGQGEAIVANKYVGIRAIVYYGDPTEIVDLSREHNDANVLSIGARFVSETDTIKVVEQWLVTPFSGDTRHKRRIALISYLENRRFWQRFINKVRTNTIGS